MWIPGRSWVITTKANPKSRVCRSRDLSEADDLREIRGLRIKFIGDKRKQFREQQ